LSGAFLALNNFEILPDYISLSQVIDTARMEVAEWREDIVCRNCRWTLCSSGTWAAVSPAASMVKAIDLKSLEYAEIRNMILLSFMWHRSFGFLSKHSLTPDQLSKNDPLVLA